MNKAKLGLGLFVVLVASAGCVTGEGGEGPWAVDVTQQAVSDCGGFDYDEVDGARGEEMNYCEAELLNWRYDATGGELALVDARAILNCCTELSIDAEMVDNVLVVTEVDDMEAAGGPCRCMCVYDFSISLDGIPEGPLAVEIYRISDETVGPMLVWSGMLDLADGSGSELISDEEGAMYCEE